MFKRNILLVFLILCQLPAKSIASGATTAESTCPTISGDSFSTDEIKEDISYAYNFKEDDKNFEPGLIHVTGAKPKRPIVLVNVHKSDMLLNTEPTFKKGYRTLSWGRPYEDALQTVMSKGSHAHEQLALPEDWTEGELRDGVSFVILPPEAKELEFTIGYAAPQKGNNKVRWGGGMQIRLAKLPKGTVVLTKSLNENSKNKTKNKTKEKTYSLQCLLKKAINQYNASRSDHKLPETLADHDLGVSGPQDFIDGSFETYTKSSDAGS